MAGKQPQRGFGNQYSGQSNVRDFDQDLAEDEHAQACSYVREQVRAQLGGQVPAWDGPIPGFWDRVKNQQYQQSSTASYGQGQPPMHDSNITRAQFQTQDQFRESQQQGENRTPNWNMSAQGMQQMSRPLGYRQHTQSGMRSSNTEPANHKGGMQQQISGSYRSHQHSQNRMSGPNLGQGQSDSGRMQQMPTGPYRSHQHSQNRMSGPNLGQGQSDSGGMQQMPTGSFGHQHSQNGMPSPNFDQQGQQTTPLQSRNIYDYSRRQ